MRIAYFDCFSGAAGDMILAALIGAGLSADDLRRDLACLPLDGYELEVREIRKAGFAATKVDVRMTAKPGHRHLKHVVDIIERSSLSAEIKERAKRVFTRLAEAEAAVHGSTIEKVHFHEVGAVDAIVDVVGAVAGLARLGIDRVCCSPIPTGSGTVKCEHGLMPVPAPATAALLVGVPLAPTDEIGELTTPTGAAILTTLAEGYGPLPAMRIGRIGVGAGTRDHQTRPNILRVFIGEGDGAVSGATVDEVAILEVNLDDVTGEQVGDVYELLFQAGALDVYTTPILMKKNRPGLLLSVMTPGAMATACEDVLFRHTGTLGVRRHVCQRRKLERTVEIVQTRFGEIPVKVGSRDGKIMVASPEYDDCARAARKHDASLRDVMFEARAAWQAAHAANR